MVSLLLGLPPINRIMLVGRVCSVPKVKKLARKNKETGEEYTRTSCAFLLQHHSYHKSSGLLIWVDTYGRLAEWLLVRAGLAKGDAVWISGRMRSRSSNFSKTQTRGHFTWIDAHMVYFIPELPKGVRDGEHYIVPAKAYDRLTIALNSGGPPELSEEHFENLLSELEEGKTKMSPPAPGKEPWDRI